MMNVLRGLGPAVLVVVGFATPLAAQYYPAQPAQASNPVCVRLESQLAALNRGGDPAQADQVRRYEEAVNRQQSDLDRTVAQSRRLGCEGLGFFSLFTGQGPQCAPLTSRIQQMRGNLDRLLSELERIKSGNGDQDGQRRAIIGQLAQNDCGPQYRTAATGPRGFFDALFGGGTIINPGGDGAPSGTYRTVCVRTCDGYYFPISYSTVPSRFPDDQRACQRMCPAAEVMLYSYRNPGEDIQQAVSITGYPYTELPNAFRYRKEFNSACSCRQAGQSWAEALKNADDRSTIERGDIVVTQDRAKALSQPPKLNAQGRKPDPRIAAPDAGTAAGADAASAADAAAEPDRANRKVRTVGPPFLPAR
jgi:hypothetical protein